MRVIPLHASRSTVDMDVPYNKSGASSRAHYQIVRNVENAPHQSEQLLLQEVERIRQRMTTKLLNTAELRKELIVLLYCMNSSFGSITSASLAFALPSAVHLAEAGSNINEKRTGYLFCSEAMPREHELQLMLVNTIRKDLTSSSSGNINIALESLVNSPSEDVIPAVQSRCVELLSHPSTRIRTLTMAALLSLARLTPELLNDGHVKSLILKRLADSDENVVHVALKLGLFMVSNNFLESEKVLQPSISLVSRITDRHTARAYSSAFTLSILNTVSKLYDSRESNADDSCANELLPSIFSILRRAVRHDQKSLILECFRILGRFPTNHVARYIIGRTAESEEPHGQEGASDKSRPRFIHPVARIRHFLSSREVNEHYLFLSCLVCLDPSLWAGTPQRPDNSAPIIINEDQLTSAAAQTSVIPLVLDQLEVERVLSFLESEDDQIRRLTLRILMSLDPSLVESCYARALDTLRASTTSGGTNEQALRSIGQRIVELACTITTGNDRLEKEVKGRMLVQKLLEIQESVDGRGRVNGPIVESTLSCIRIRRESMSVQHDFIITLFSLLRDNNTSATESDFKTIGMTLFLTLVALLCELAHTFATSRSEVVSMICLLATTLHTSPVSLQEPILLCMTRLVVLLSPTELTSLEIEDVRRVVNELGESPLDDKRKASVIKRCGQFEKSLTYPERMSDLLGSTQTISLPEFALILDQVDRRLSSPRENASEKSLSPPSGLSSPPNNLLKLSSLSQSKLRYDAYAPPPTASVARLFRARSRSSATSGRSSNRASSRASSSRLDEHDADAELSKTVTAGELTLAVTSRNEFANAHRSKKGKLPDEDQTITKIKKSDIASNAISSKLLALDSPFLPEPLVDFDNNAPIASPGASPFVSASTSLRTSPEPGPSFEELWMGMGVKEGTLSARGWCDDAVDVVVRRLQSLGCRMDLLSSDVPPFEGDLKISFHCPSASPGTMASRAPSGLLRLHEEEDGSCRWQIRCIDKEFGMKVKEFML